MLRFTIKCVAFVIKRINSFMGLLDRTGFSTYLFYRHLIEVLFRNFIAYLILYLFYSEILVMPTFVSSSVNCLRCSKDFEV